MKMDNRDASIVGETGLTGSSRPLLFNSNSNHVSRHSAGSSTIATSTVNNSSSRNRLEVDHTGGSSMRDRTANRSIPERVAQFYYTLGLFCSSHPILVIAFAICIVLFSCYPLLGLPLPGNKPQEFLTSYENYTIPPLNGWEWEGSDWPRWYKGPPATFIQQVIIKSTVLPWNSDLILTDAFRGPLAEVFHVVDTLKNAHAVNGSASLSDLCFKVLDVKSKALKGKISMLPEYNCLILSPANFWQQNYAKFQADPDILATILNYQSHQKGRSGLAEILLGMNVKETGLKRYPFKARQRIVTYAVTLVLQTYDRRYVTDLKSSLLKLYPPKSYPSVSVVKSIHTEGLQNHINFSDNLSKDGQLFEDNFQVEEEERIFHIFYPSQSSLLELVPLVFTYCAMFVYVYFSVKKVEMISSKLGMAFSALATVVASLCMSVGLCSHFGMTFEINAKAIYPYLVVIIGLENILVLTRSVVSTATHLDVKIRVAQGLSKEGWSITKNLLTEITILTIGFFTFVPIIQEFCILAIVGLVSDFFLQTFFFATVLSVDIHRTKLSPDSTHHFAFCNAPFRTPLHPTTNSLMSMATSSSASKLPRIKSNPKINPENCNLNVNGVFKKPGTGPTGSVSVVAPSQAAPILVKIPKRLRLVYFWARTRFFQRTFTIFMVGWISVIIYESGIVAHFNYETEDVVVPINHQHHNHNNDNANNSVQNLSHISLTRAHTPGKFGGKPSFIVQNLTQHHQQNHIIDNYGAPQGSASSVSSYQNAKMLKELYHKNPYVWRRLSPYHWQVLLGVYNISLSGKYISVLPPICISIAVEPQVAMSLRHPHEQNQARKFNWQALANALDPLDIVDEYDSSVPTVSPLGKIGKKGLISSSSEDPYIPSSPVELALTMLLAIPSVIVISYTMVVFYRCICSRNYAEWRSSWAKGNSESSQDSYTQVVFEAVPLVLDGHKQEVECIGSDGNVIASVCLSGVLKIWNTSSGENIVTVDRKRFFERLSVMENEDGCNFITSDGDSAGCSPPSQANSTFSNPYDLIDRPLLSSDRENQRRRSQIQLQQHSSHTQSHQHQQLQSQSSFDQLQQQQHITHDRKSSSYAQFSPPIGTCITSSNSSAALNNFEFNFIRSHRRTASSPTNCGSQQNPSLPIPIPYRGSSNSPFNNSSQVHTMSNIYNSGNNNNGTNYAAANNVTFPSHNTSMEQLSRVGTPLDKITESVSNKINDDTNAQGFNGGSGYSFAEDVPAVWCLDCQENIIVLGTQSGRLELWDAFTGFLKCTYEDSSSAGVMCVKIIGNRIVAARLNGSLDFIEIESFYSNGQRESPSPYHRWHTSDGMEYNRPSMFSLDAEIRCVWLTTLKAHQQPITCLDCEGGRILTGSQDHTLKVFRLEDHLPLYTLHGHYGPITCLFIDKISPMTSGSGSQDGMLCVWDLLTGMCMYSIQAHDGPVSALTYSASYIISVGGDDKICVWERFQGHLLNTIQLDHAYCSSLVMLTHNLLITSKQGSLIVWDVRTGEPVRAVRLGHRDNAVFVRQILGCADAVLCDYGSQLRLVRFPTVVNKVD